MEKPRERNLNCIQQCSIKKFCLVAEKKKMQEKKRKNKICLIEEAPSFSLLILCFLNSQTQECLYCFGF